MAISLPQNEIVITGEELDRRHGITIGGKPAWLSESPFQAFLALAAACLSGNRPVRLRAKHVWTLRQQIAEGIGLAAAHSMIITAGAGRYAPEPDWQISVAPRFRTCVLRASKSNRRRAAILKLL